MRLRDWLPDVAGPDVEITGLAEHAAEVRPGDAFIALPGRQCHGLDFAAEAAANGAVVVLHASGDSVPPLSVPAVAVAGLGPRLGALAARFYGHPSREMEIIGITGTNGKTSCSFYLAQILGGAVMGTLGWGRPGSLHPSAHTTAPAIATQRRLAALRDAGVTTVAMEVSSHALDQGRVAEVAFDAAVWTNLSRDHLDYHGDLQRYAAAKRRLLAWPGLEAAVVNLDDPVWPAMREACRGKVVGYAWRTRPAADFPVVQARQVRFAAAGIEFEAVFQGDSQPVRVGLLGEGNLENALATLALLLARGWTLPRAAEALGELAPVPGRMECFRAPGRPLVVVDYAHTPAALEMALTSLRRHCHGRLWVVFGCGGDRDRGKRPLMGRIAERLADAVILTDDNPRTEDGAAIAAAIAAGMARPPRIVRDRGEAIDRALAEAGEGDVVLVAGKGHETWQEVGERRLPFSDREWIQNRLAEEATCV